MIYIRKNIFENSIKNEIKFINKLIEKEKSQMAFKDNLISSLNVPKEKNLNELYEELEKIEKKYSETQNEENEYEKPEYIKMEYQALSDDEIKSKAETYAESEYNAKKAVIDKEYLDKLDALNKEKNSVKESKNAISKQIEKDYSAAINDLNNSLLKRGLARSSIAANLEGSALNEKAASLSEAAISASNKIGEIDSEISSLTAEKESALANLDIAKAATVTEQINALKKEREDKQQEVIKYNNEIEKDIAEYNKYLHDKENDKPQLTDNLEITEKEKTAFVKNYLKNFSKKDAMEILFFSDLKNYITQESLKSLIDEI